MKSLNEVVEMIDQAERIFNSETDWEIKYDTIFGMKIWPEIRENGYRFEYYDPDTTYEEDITAYVKALIEFRDRIRPILDIVE